VEYIENHRRQIKRKVEENPLRFS